MPKKQTSDIKIKSYDRSEKDDLEEMLERPRARNKGSKKIITWIISLVVIVIIIFGALYSVSKFTKFNVLGLSKFDSSDMSAVFLSSGEVYFGTIKSSIRKQYVTLDDIYYIRVSPKLQNQAPLREGDVGEDSKQQLTLVQLGSELHKPMNYMKINRDHIIFIEDLSKDSSVIKAIEKQATEN